MLHLHLLPFLCFPHDVHQNVDGTLVWHIGFAIQDRYSQYDTQSILASGFELFQGGALTVEFGLSIQVGRTSGGICLVRGIAWLAGENICSASWSVRLRIDFTWSAVSGSVRQRLKSAPAPETCLDGRATEGGQERGKMRTICGDVNQEYITFCTKSGEVTSSLDIELACAFGVLVDLVREAVCSAVHHNLGPVVIIVSQ